MRFILAILIAFTLTDPAFGQESISQRLSRLEATQAEYQKQVDGRFDKLEAKIDDLANMLMAMQAMQAAKAAATLEAAKAQSVNAPVTRAVWSPMVAQESVTMQFMSSMGGGSCANGSCGSSGGRMGRRR